MWERIKKHLQEPVIMETWEFYMLTVFYGAISAYLVKGLRFMICR